ncbi:hypothetical protein ABE82_26530 (plasmid) [Paenibacillus peoriae]|uniref:hypothetical protein n=1 Tax=Paenibacillus peoriae TaxID=59893 RepID=UPI00071F1525|nr:hypothetical protein [Paenibacillus peoriae]ALS09971.1 hypothetical protein ABE82_26530 [Paenibacillus peoriae]
MKTTYIAKGKIKDWIQQMEDKHAASTSDYNRGILDACQELNKLLNGVSLHPDFSVQDLEQQMNSEEVFSLILSEGNPVHVYSTEGEAAGLLSEYPKLTKLTIANLTQGILDKWGNHEDSDIVNFFADGWRISINKTSLRIVMKRPRPQIVKEIPPEGFSVPEHIQTLLKRSDKEINELIEEALGSTLIREGLTGKTLVSTPEGNRCLKDYMRDENTAAEFCTSLENNHPIEFRKHLVTVMLAKQDVSRINRDIMLELLKMNPAQLYNANSFRRMLMTASPSLQERVLACYLLLTEKQSLVKAISE